MAAGIDRIGALVKAFEFIYKSETDGDYHEFGVFQGVSIARAIKANVDWQKKTKRNHVNRYFGFDSFEGLPVFDEKDQLSGYNVFHEGQFNNTSIDIVHEKIISEGQSLENVNLIQGLFSDSLSSSNTINKLGESKVAIAHIDCDLYSSAQDCLKFLNGRLADGAIILFDDWFCYLGRPDRGVNKAFTDWIQESNYTMTEYFNYSWAGKAFILNISEMP